MMLELDLLQISIGNKSDLQYSPSLQEWERCFSFSKKQSLIGFLFNAIEHIHSIDSSKSIINDVLLMKWFGYKDIIQKRNQIVNKRIQELSSLFSKGGFHTCLLKGQGNALYYPDSSLRSSGDVDLWVDGKRDEIVGFIKSLGVKVHDIHLVHADAEFFDDVHVEIHFQPSWMYNPFTEQKLEKFFQEQANDQFQLYDGNVGFTHPSLYFNLVYNLVHINRHIFDEGIGLRQLVDYYYILKESDILVRKQAMMQINKLHLSKFTASLMYVMQEALGMKDELLLCSPNEKLGRKLLMDIVEGGNFGKYGKYARTTSNDQRIKRAFDSLRRNWQFITTYPGEVLFIPYFKIWHWCWRKYNGYL